jgi:hypothetical protein
MAICPKRLLGLQEAYSWPPKPTKRVEVANFLTPLQAVGQLPRRRRNIKGRPFWSRVWVVASIPTERNALNG